MIRSTGRVRGYTGKARNHPTAWLRRMARAWDGHMVLASWALAVFAMTYLVVR